MKVKPLFRAMLCLLAAALSLTLFTVPTRAAVTEVAFWGDWGGEGQAQFQTMVDAFNKTHTDIHVSYVLTEDMLTKFLTASTSGAAPDVMFWDRFRTALYGPKNVLLPLDDLMSKDNVSPKDFYAEALRELTYNGKLYGLPITVDARALFYNKKLLADAGVKPPTTWDELEQAAIKLTKRDASGKLIQAGFSLQDTGLFSMYLQQAGGKMLTDDGQKTAFNGPEGKQVLAFWDKLVNKDKVYDLGFEQGLGEGTDAFVTGKVAMLYTGPWMISTYKKFGKDLDFGIVPPPAGPKGDKSSVMGGFGLVIPKASKNQAAAWEFIKWWCGQPENSLLWAKTSLNLPGNLKAVNDDFFQKDNFWKPIIDTLAFAKVRPTVAGYPPMEGDALMPNLQLFMQGKLSADDALATAQKQGDPILADNNNP